ncbi:MAG TPA: pyridoxamine 5'-phosphate oxidase family protein [Hyphomonadaceae bacterium]
MPMFHNGNRDLQELFGSRALADRLVERLRHSEFTEDDKAFIESLEFFFLATADPIGRPDCSFKGGAPGFARVIQPDLLVWPDYDGNGMFKSLGNIAINPSVGLLFIRFGEKPKRLRVNGTAQVVFDDPLMEQFEGAQALIRLTPVDIFPNCPRYIPDPANAKPSPFIPHEDQPRVEPGWKDNPAWKDVVPPRKA